MSRRHVIAIAIAVVFAVLAVWSLAIWHQYRAEQQLAGIWQFDDPQSGKARANIGGMFLMADGRYVFTRIGTPPVGPPVFWSVRGHELILDMDHRPLHIAIRPLASLLGLSPAPTRVYQFEVTADRLVLIEPNGNHTDWTRVTEK